MSYKIQAVRLILKWSSLNLFMFVIEKKTLKMQNQLKRSNYVQNAFLVGSKYLIQNASIVAPV